MRLQVFSLQLCQKKRLRSFRLSFANKIKTLFLKYTSKQLLALKLVPIAVDINVTSDINYQKESALFSFWDLIMTDLWKFLLKLVSKLFWYWSFLCILIFNKCKETAFFKFQFISDENINKKISHKNYLKLSKDNPQLKPRLRGNWFVLWYRNV